MTSNLFQDFDERSKEVSKYFILIKNLEQGSIKLAMGKDYKKIKTIDNNRLETLRATGFLLLYNLVESTMRNGIERIFEELENQNISFDNLKNEVKKIIINNFKKNYSTDNLLNTINNISLDIISASFDKKKLFSGNIDARKIKDTANQYRFSCETNAQKTQNGSDLLTVKTNRNDLAHGFKSFEEVGRDATADELLVIKNRVIAYLRDILENIERYLSNQDYLNS